MVIMITPWDVTNWARRRLLCDHADASTAAMKAGSLEIKRRVLN